MKSGLTGEEAVTLWHHISTVAQNLLEDFVILPSQLVQERSEIKWDIR